MAQAGDLASRGSQNSLFSSRRSDQGLVERL